jgi:hypothetical protein
VAVRGTISFKLADYRAFIKLHRLIDFDLNAFQLQIRDATGILCAAAMEAAILDAVRSAQALGRYPAAGDLLFLP